MSQTFLSVQQVSDVANKELDFEITQAHRDQLKDILAIEKYQDTFQETQLREQLDKWHRQRKFRNPRIDFKSNLLEQSSSIVIELIVKHLSEERTFSREEDPYDGQIPDRNKPLEELWGEPYQKTFSKSKKSWVRTGSSFITECDKCRAKGSIRCSSCRGRGEKEERCARCSGSGSVRSHGGASDPGSNNEERCHHCFGSGKIDERCNRCHGDGEVKCPKCDGKRKLHIYDAINAKNSIEEAEEALTVHSTFNPKWLTKVEPNLVLDHTRYTEETPNNEMDSFNIGKQYLIKVYEVKRIEIFYKEDRELFMINDKVFSVGTDYLYDKNRIMLLVIGALFVIFLIIWLVMHFG